MLDREACESGRSEGTRALEAKGAATALSACAEAFLNEPDETVVGDLRRVASSFGDGSFDDVACDGALVQRFNDRLFVTNSPYFVPLYEGSVVAGGKDAEGVMRYASVESARRGHVARCYRAVGFDHRSLQGFEPAVASLHEDSLAAELAFLAHLKTQESMAWSAGEAAEARHWSSLAAQFAREHTAVWAGKAAACLRASDDDFYARACCFAAWLCEEVGRAGDEEARSGAA